MKEIFFPLLTMLLIGCASSYHRTYDGIARPQADISAIRMVLGVPASLKYEKVGEIFVTMETNRRNTIARFRMEAAQMGANCVVVVKLYPNDSKGIALYVPSLIKPKGPLPPAVEETGLTNQLNF